MAYDPNASLTFNLGTSNFGRSKELCVCQGACDYCGSGQRVIISIDTSSGEYGPADLCVDCINEMKDELLEKIGEPV